MSVLIGMCGCGQAQSHSPATLTRLVLERGHGSMWGNQFYIDICPTQINQVRFFSPEDPGGELLLRENISIPAEDWSALQAAVDALSPNLQKQKWPNAKRGKLDGGEFHKLTLTWDQKEISYQWPADGSADGLEQLLENIAAQLSHS